MNIQSYRKLYNIFRILLSYFFFYTIFHVWKNVDMRHLTKYEMNGMLFVHIDYLGLCRKGQDWLQRKEESACAYRDAFEAWFRSACERPGRQSESGNPIALELYFVDGRLDDSLQIRDGQGHGHWYWWL